MSSADICPGDASGPCSGHGDIANSGDGDIANSGDGDIAKGTAITVERALATAATMAQKEAIAKDNRERKIKCVVWDLDNTLWRGTLLENSNVVMR
ncbi:MAG: hypothetical protein HQK66_09745, partial [Desulfamplus sp.]|nr:hypothetical protein [Desulfamplus sp.]